MLLRKVASKRTYKVDGAANIVVGQTQVVKQLNDMQLATPGFAIPRLENPT